MRISAFARRRSICAMQTPSARTGTGRRRSGRGAVRGEKVTHKQQQRADTEQLGTDSLLKPFFISTSEFAFSLKRRRSSSRSRWQRSHFANLSFFTFGPTGLRTGSLRLPPLVPSSPGYLSALLPDHGNRGWASQRCWKGKPDLDDHLNGFRSTSVSKSLYKLRGRKS